MVPILSNWFLKDHITQNKEGKFQQFRNRVVGYTKGITNRSKWAIGIYLITIIAMLAVLWQSTGTEIFPKVNSGQLQVRLRMPDGTRIENTERKTIHTQLKLNLVIWKKRINKKLKIRKIY